MQPIRKPKKQALFAIGIALAFLFSALFTYGPAYNTRIPSWDRVYAFFGLNNYSSVYQDYPFVATFLDVGQGDCTLFHTADTTIVIDTGSDGNATRILRELESMGTSEIDLLVATHPHEDHVGSMVELMDNLPVDQFLVHGPRELYGQELYYGELMAAAARWNIPITYGQAGQSLTVGSFTIEILGPVTYFPEDQNNNSLVLLITYEDKRFLLAGDAEEEEENTILMTQPNLKADVLKVGHHGSSSSTSPRWLGSCAPSLAVISCGKDNSYGHPHGVTLDRLNGANCQVFRTDEQGTVYLVLDGKNPYIYAKNA